MIAIRKSFPIFHRARFPVGAYNENLDVKDVTWLSPDGTEMTIEQWQDGNARCFGMLLDGRAQRSGIRKRGEDATVLLVYNSYHDVVRFKLPEASEGQVWLGILDTNQPEQQPPAFPPGHVFDVTGRSFLAFALAKSDRAIGELRRLFSISTDNASDRLI